MTKFMFRFKKCYGGYIGCLWVIDGERRYPFFGGPVAFGKSIGESINIMCKRKPYIFDKGGEDLESSQEEDTDEISIE